MIASLQIAGKINRIIRETRLQELGQLEQDLVFGDAGAKDVINFLRTKQASIKDMWLDNGDVPCSQILAEVYPSCKSFVQDETPENKLRLLMIYASVYPEKFVGDRGLKLMQVAKEFLLLDFSNLFCYSFPLLEADLSY